ncbi:MAG: hypothetical protein PHD82_14740, partial [Candidatus Riflebacteria bacterium]|nr:hypothetical protein [Candidatus Riflebacteria bacterium]
SGQVLEALPDSGEMAGPVSGRAVIERAGGPGTTLSGSAGLITIPSPGYKKEHSVGVSFKTSTVKNDMAVGGQIYSVEKDEHLMGIRYNARPNLELSVNNLRYERTSKPLLTGVDTEKDHLAVGMKYTARQDETDFCIGFNFAPMSSKEMNLADIEQIENMRQVYVTMGEKISDNFSGFLNLSSVFTNNQEIDLGNGFTQKINRKDIVMGGVGLEYNLAKGASVFGEAKFGNYRDFDYFKKDSVRHRIHAGARVGTENAQLELIGLNVTDGDPTFVIGGSFGF